MSKRRANASSDRDGDDREGGGDFGRSLLSGFLQTKKVDVVSFSEAHWRVGQSAFVRHGKGRHPAALNFGDCLTCAIADVAGEPLLCVGKDFAQTDLELVLWFSVVSGTATCRMR